MDAFRYAVALVMLLASPWFGFWFLIHPFVGFWRRLGLVWTWTLMTGLMLGLGAALYPLRGWVLAVEFGTHPPLAALGVAVLVASGVMRARVQRQLSNATLAGGPELSPEGGGELLTQGMYAHMRHPRYAQLTLGLVGWALLANYLATYVIAAASVPVLYLTALLEERELRERFGDAYRAYAARVPRFVPRLRPS